PLAGVVLEVLVHVVERLHGVFATLITLLRSHLAAIIALFIFRLRLRCHCSISCLSKLSILGYRGGRRPRVNAYLTQRTLSENSARERSKTAVTAPSCPTAA